MATARIKHFYANRIIPRIATVRRVAKADARKATVIACAARVRLRKARKVIAAGDPDAAMLRLLRDGDELWLGRLKMRVYFQR